MLLVLAACAPSEPPAPVVPPSEDTAGDTDTGGDTAETGPEVPPPALTAAEVGAALDAALSGGIPTFPEAIGAFSALMALGVGCTPDDRFFKILDPEGCLAPSGVTYSGAGGAVGGWDDAGEVYAYELRGDLVIIDAAGVPYEMGGDIDTVVTPYVGGLAFSQQFLGTFRYPAAPTWLGRGTSGSAWIEAGIGDDGALVAQVDGGYDLGGASVYFDALTVGGACGSAPTGAIRLRDVSGYWYVFTYGPECDMCGDVAYAGDSLGAACVDPTAAMAGIGEAVRTWMSDHPVVTE
jgi:hypothetical protein